MVTTLEKAKPKRKRRINPQMSQSCDPDCVLDTRRKGKNMQRWDKHGMVVPTC